MMSEKAGDHVFPAWKGEYIGTRAVALACCERTKDAARAAEIARRTSRGSEAVLLSSVADAIIAAQQGNARPGSAMLAKADAMAVWDPVVCGLRASPDLATELASDPPSRRLLEPLYAATNDLGLARRAGFRTRATRAPDELLTPRESEVMGLIARGMKNRDIAKALYISQSTAKVHVRHVFEKLGVRTRTEAVARYEKFNAG